MDGCSFNHRSRGVYFKQCDIGKWFFSFSLLLPPSRCPLNAIYVYPLNCRFDYCTRNLFDRRRRHRREEQQERIRSCRLQNNFDSCLINHWTAQKTRKKNKKSFIAERDYKTFKKSSRRVYTRKWCLFGAQASWEINFSFVVAVAARKEEQQKRLVVHWLSLDGTQKKGSGSTNVARWSCDNTNVACRIPQYLLLKAFSPLLLSRLNENPNQICATQAEEWKRRKKRAQNKYGHSIRFYRVLESARGEDKHIFGCCCRVVSEGKHNEFIINNNIVCDPFFVFFLSARSLADIELSFFQFGRLSLSTLPSKRIDFSFLPIER